MAEVALDYNLRSTQGFVEILSSSNEWQTIDDLMAICDEAGYWESDFESRALTNAKKMIVCVFLIVRDPPSRFRCVNEVSRTGRDRRQRTTRTTAKPDIGNA